MNQPFFPARVGKDFHVIGIASGRFRQILRVTWRAESRWRNYRRCKFSCGPSEWTVDPCAHHYPPSPVNADDDGKEDFFFLPGNSSKVAKSSVSRIWIPTPATATGVGS